MTKVILRKRAARSGEFGLFPVDEQGYELVAKLPNNRDVGADVKRSRNLRHHRLFFAILRFVQMHSPVMSGVPIKALKHAIKVATCFGQHFVDTETGKNVFVPGTISWETDQTEFDPFFEDACRVIAERWMPPGTTPESVRQELIAMIDGPHAIGSKVA